LKLITLEVQYEEYIWFRPQRSSEIHWNYVLLLWYSHQLKFLCFLTSAVIVTHIHTHTFICIYLQRKNPDETHRGVISFVSQSLTLFLPFLHPFRAVVSFPPISRIYLPFIQRLGEYLKTWHKDGCNTPLRMTRTVYRQNISLEVVTTGEKQRQTTAVATFYSSNLNVLVRGPCTIKYHPHTYI
jgi:hypothetical protein